MSWDAYYGSYGAYVGQDRGQDRGRGRGERGGGGGPPRVRDHRGQPISPRVPPRDPRPTGQPISPRVPPRDPRPPRPVEDPRVTTPPFPQEPDPRVTTRPEDLFPSRDDRDRDHRRRHRRHRHQEDPPWGHRYFRDYVFVYDWGWFPRWFPYWDPRWLDYWFLLFEYYGGDANADYAAYAADVVLREYARRYGWL